MLHFAHAWFLVNKGRPPYTLPGVPRRFLGVRGSVHWNNARCSPRMLPFLAQSCFREKQLRLHFPAPLGSLGILFTNGIWMGWENVCRIQTKSKLRSVSAFSKLSLSFSHLPTGCQHQGDLGNHTLNMAEAWSAWVSLSHWSEWDRHWTRFWGYLDTVRWSFLYCSSEHNLTLGLTWFKLVISSISWSMILIIQKRLKRQPSSPVCVQLTQLVRNSLCSSHWCIISCLFQKGFGGGFHCSLNPIWWIIKEEKKKIKE